MEAQMRNLQLSDDPVVFDPRRDVPGLASCSLTGATDAERVESCVMDLFVAPRRTLHRWSKITDQTAHTKIGYVGQHLASVILNTRGCKTGARGDDCLDRTEVKSCSRVDQSDKCLRCRVNLHRHAAACPNCGRKDKIKRNNDSKWLLTIRSVEKLNDYLNLARILMIIEDYPGFQQGNYADIRIRAYEIYPTKEIGSRFAQVLKHYWTHIFSENKKKNPKRTPAPKNFWPDSYEFHMCNPVEMFSCTVERHLTEPRFVLNKWIRPHEVRRLSDVAAMPWSILKPAERTLAGIGEPGPGAARYVTAAQKSKLSLRHS